MSHGQHLRSNRHSVEPEFKKRRSGRMRQIDLHGCRSSDEALTTFVAVYNELLQHGREEVLRVIHGYGSTGIGGKIRRRLHEFLRQHADCLDDWVDGEVLRNPGVTVVYLRWRLPQP